MITAAGLCPFPPILVRQLTGAEPVAPELREACSLLVARLIEKTPDVLVVVGPGPRTEIWPPDARLDPALFAPMGSASKSVLPASLGIGSYLLDQSPYEGRRVLQAVDVHASAGTCAALAHELASSSDRVALLAMGDGSARRTLKAPGYLDPRAIPFDDQVVRALEAADFQALAQVDGDLARDLMASGWLAWQVLAGALRSMPATVEVLYKDDPFGVLYFVAAYTPRADHYRD